MTDNIKEIFKVSNILFFDGTQMLIGTGADPAITMVSDFDLMEMIDYDNIHDVDTLYKVLHKIWRFFRNIFINAKQNYVTYPVIPDLKCGTFNSYPIRWNYRTITSGYQYIENKKITFIQALQQQSTIKIDYLAFLPDNKGYKKYIEFSSNYYFNLNLTKNFPDIETSTIVEELIRISIEKMKKTPFKAMKRLYSAMKMTNKYRPRFPGDVHRDLRFLTDLFNGTVGHIAKTLNDLELIPDVLEHRDIPDHVLKENLETIIHEALFEYRPLLWKLLEIKDRDDLVAEIKSINEQLLEIVNQKTIPYIKAHKRMIHKLVSFDIHADRLSRL